MLRPQFEAAPARINFTFRRLGRHPIFEAVDVQRRFVAIGHDKQAGNAGLPQFTEAIGVGRPAQHLDVHADDRKGGLLRDCYPAVTGYDASSAAALVTIAASRLPGREPSRSEGPLTLTAASTLPDRSRTGALTLATPASRSPTLSAHPRLRTVASAL